MCPCSGAPLLGVPSLADPSAEASDGRTLRFLLTKALALQKKEEDEERRKVEEQEKLKTMTEKEEEEQARRELRTLLAVPAPRRTAEQETRVRACRSVLSAAHKRKRKKRRKKKTPRASSHPWLRRARLRQRYVRAGFAGYVTPCAVFPSFVNARGDSTGAVLGQGDVPVVILSGGFGQTVQKTADSPQLQSIAGRQHPLRAANADPHGPVCSADHGDSTVAAYFGGLCSCCAGSCRFSRAAVEKPLALPQLQLVEKSVVGLFWVMTSGNVPVFSAYWFDTGYMSTSVSGGFWKIFTYFLRQGGPRIPKSIPSYFSAMLGSTVDICLAS